jgi:hypothetical protein
MNKKDKQDIVARLIEKSKTYVPKPREKESAEAQLGYMIGEYIVLRFLPVLNTSMIKTNNIINVSEEELIEYKRLDELWYKNHGKNKPEAKEDWFNLRKFDHELEKKYLPHILECNLYYVIDVENIIDLKAGIRKSLWDCDVCCYKIEPDDIIIENFHDICTVIKLTLDIDREIRY